MNLIKMIVDTVCNTHRLPPELTLFDTSLFVVITVITRAFNVVKIRMKVQDLDVSKIYNKAKARLRKLGFRIENCINYKIELSFKKGDFLEEEGGQVLSSKNIFNEENDINILQYDWINNELYESMRVEGIENIIKVGTSEILTYDSKLGANVFRPNRLTLDKELFNEAYHKYMQYVGKEVLFISLLKKLKSITDSTGTRFVRISGLEPIGVKTGIFSFDSQLNQWAKKSNADKYL